MEQMARAVIKKIRRVNDVKTDMLTDEPSTAYLSRKECGEKSVEREVPTSTRTNTRSMKTVGITADYYSGWKN